MNSKVFAVALAIITVTTAWSGQAFATQPGNNGGGNGGCGVGQQTNGCGTASNGTPTSVTANPTASASAGALAGAAAISTSTGGTGYGGAGGAGGNASSGVIGSGNSSVKNDNTNVGINDQKQGQAQSASSDQKQNQSSSATGGNATGNGAGNTTSIRLGDVHMQQAAQAAPAYAPAIPGVPTSCWMYIGFGAGGSSTATTASVSGGIPIGNVGICVAGAQVRFMAGINEQDKAAGRPATFGPDDFLMSVCENVNGMDKMRGCQKPSPSAGPVKKAEGTLSTDPLIARRQLTSMMEN